VNRRALMSIILFGALAVAAIGVLVLALVNESSKAEDERADNQRAIQVNAALACERGERLKDDRNTDLAGEINKKGFVQISLGCQNFVAVLQEDLVFSGGQVKIQNGK
jgi:hypothetical protein